MAAEEIGYLARESVARSRLPLGCVFQHYHHLSSVGLGQGSLPGNATLRRLQELPVVFALDRAGVVGQDGPTHNGVFDIAYLRTLPGMTLCAPRDETDMRRMLEACLRIDGPSALRFPRGNCPRDEVIHEGERRSMEPGKAEVLRPGERVTIWAYGSMVSTALEVAARLDRRGLRVGVVDARWAKPLDEELLLEHIRSQRWIATLEDHQRSGGFGSALLEAWSRLALRGGEERPARVKMFGIPDRFVEHMSSREEQLAALGLDADAVERSLTQLLSASRVG